MIVEQLVFVVIAFAIFVYMFFKMMRQSDISYIIILVLETIGIALNFLEVLFGVKLNIVFVIIKYILAFIIFIVGAIIDIIRQFLEKYTVNKILDSHVVEKITKKAKKILLQLTSKYPNNYEAHRLLAEMYEKEGGMRKAIDEYVQAIDIYKQDYDSFYRVAHLLTYLDRKDDATQMLTTLLEKKPDFYEATILLGDLLIEKGSYKEAVGIYQDALRYNPTSFDINYNLGIVYTMLNDFQNAKVCYEKAAELNALSYTAKYSLAEIELIYKNLEDAEKKFLEVIESEELSADAYCELAKIHLIKNDKDTAIKYANVSIDIDAKRMVKKIKADPIFIPILAKLTIPFNLEHKDENEEAINKDKQKTKINEKDLKVKEHLEEVIDITRNLSYTDINLLKKEEYKKEIQSDEKNKKRLLDKEQREKQ